MHSYFKALFAIVLVGILSSFGAQSILAQGYANNIWYFGNSATSIKFNKGADRSIFRDNDQAVPFGQGGSAVATDANTGKLIFYTDGLGLYDQQHQLISNFTNGNNAQSQPVAICHVPDSTDLYYVFTKDAANTLYYHVVKHQDSTIVTRFTDSITLVTNTTEALLMLSGGSISEPNYWLLLQSGNELKSFQIGPDLENPISETGSIALGFNVGNISSRADTINSINDFWLGLSPTDLSANVHLIDFDAVGGAFSNLRELQATNGINRRVFDTEWSNDGRKFYISRSTPNGGMVFQYNTDPSADPQTAIQAVLPSEVGASHGLQMGPDGNIYHLYQAQGQAEIRLASIALSDSLPDSLVYDVEVFNNINVDGRQFPQFLPPKPTDVNIVINVNGTACQNQPAVLSAMVTNNLGENIEPEQYFWDVNNGAFQSTAVSPVFTFPDAGGMLVQLVVMVNGLPYQAVENVQVTAFDVQFSNLPTDTTICELPFTYTAELEGSAQIFWSNNATVTPNPEGTFDRSGTYWAIADNGSCQTFATLTIELYGEQKQTSNIWYFGNNAGIDFNQQPAVSLSNSIMQAPEGCAVIGNSNGEPLFYTDGQTVYAITDKINNTGHVEMENGDSIGGDPGSLQSALIIQFPDDETQFYIFTTREVPNDSGAYVLSYSIVDIKENGGLGAVVAKNIPIMVGCTESVTASGTSGANVLLYAHELGSNVFRTYSITADGISQPSFFTAGSVIDENTITGYMKISSNSQMVAQALETAGQQMVEIHAFDTLGNYTDTYTLNLQNPVGRVYGMEFSPVGNKLLVTVSSPGNSQIYEFRVDSLDEAYMNTAVFVHEPIAAELGAIQRAPDGSTYVAVNGAGSLGTLSINDAVLDFPTQNRSSFNLQGFTLAGGTTSQLGLPNFIQNQANSLQTPGISISENACVNTPFELSGTGSSDIDTYEWQVTDANGGVVFTSSSQVDQFTPTLPGVYTARLTVRNECLLPGNDIVGVFTESFEAFPLPIVSNIPDFFVLCAGEATIGILPEAGNTYLWSTGQTTSQITVNLEGNYQVTVTNANGCSDIANVRVAPPYSVALGLDRSVCSGSNLVLDAQVNGANYQWFVNNVSQPGADQRTFVVNTSVGGDYTIRVDVADPADPSCTVSDEVIVSVTELNLVVDAVVPSSCLGNGGQIDITISGASNYIVSWADDASIVSEDRNGLSPGIYSVTVTSNGCSRSQDIAITSSDGPQVNAPLEGDPANCDGLDGDIEGILTAGTFTIPVLYTLILDGVQIHTNQPLPFIGASNSFEIVGLSPGNYSIIITDDNGNGCTYTQDNIVVNEAAQVGLRLFLEDGATQTEIFPSNNFVTICGGGTSIFADPSEGTAGTFWSSTGPDGNPNFPNSPDSKPLNLVAPRDYGTFTYQVLASTGGVNPCDTIREVIVSFLPEPTFTINTEIQCDGSVLLTTEGLMDAPANTTYNYRWMRNGQQIGSADSLLITTEGDYNGADFELLIRYNENLSCFGASNPVGTFTVTGPLSVSLASSPACDDGEPIVLTANTSTLAGISFTWLDPSGNVIPNANGPEIEVMAEGTYKVEVRRIAGNAACAESATYLLDRLPIPVSNLEPRVLFCETVPSLDPGVFESYLWRFPDGSTSTSRAVDVINAGTYSVDITLNGCTVTEKVIAVLDCKPLVIVANAFRPASSQGNGTFKVLFTEYVVDFSLFVYNRWGEMVFQSDDLAFEWNGTTAGGDLAPHGTYAYVMKFKSETNPERGVIEQRGAITLLR